MVLLLGVEPSRLGLQPSALTAYELQKHIMALTSALPTSFILVRQSSTRGLWGFISPTTELMLQFKGNDAVPLPLCMA